MKEEILQYIWEQGAFHSQNLLSTSGEEIVILKLGLLNRDAGPDFHNASLIIGGIRWEGQVELHINSSDWYKHQHQNDPAYNSVILHVVLKEDEKIFSNNRELPCLELGDRLDPNFIIRYQSLLQRKGFISCENLLPKVPQNIMEMALEQMAIHRLMKLYDRLTAALPHCGGNWEMLFWERMIYSFGLRVNAHIFSDAFLRLPFKAWQWLASSLAKVEAALFGLLGAIPKNPQDAYSLEMRQHFEVLKIRFSISEPSKPLWKKGRMQPKGLPAIRIAQFAQFYFNNAYLAKSISGINLNQVMAKLDVSVSTYWRKHSDFSRPRKFDLGQLGYQKKVVIINNAIIPFLFSYGRSHGDEILCSRALAWWEQGKKETNQVTKSFETIGFSNTNAMQSGALVHLKKEFCNEINCLECPIGHHILKKEKL